MNINKLLISTSLVAGALLSASAWSVNLTSAGWYVLPGTTVAARPELAGTVLEDLISNFTLDTGDGNTVSGTIQSRVVMEDVTGTLDFYWRVTPLEGSAEIGDLRLGGFGSYALDADWRIDGLGSLAPSGAYYWGSTGSYAGYVNFSFDPALMTGDSSYFMFLHTDATSYSLSAFMDIANPGNTQASASMPTWAPVPVPAAAWLFGSAIVGLVGIARRNK